VWGWALREGLGGRRSFERVGPITDIWHTLRAGAAQPRERVLMSPFLPPVARFGDICALGVLISPKLTAGA
jgi:hypothetical protein